jgi:hypothetical protein
MVRVAPALTAENTARRLVKDSRSRATARRLVPRSTRALASSVGATRRGLRRFAAARRSARAVLAVVAPGPVLRVDARRDADRRGGESRREAFGAGRRRERAAPGVEAAFRERRAGVRFAMPDLLGQPMESEQPGL